MKEILSITRKELDGYFGSPMALIFIGAFLAISLFAFFWVDAFFARGVADVRPLFRWMPVLLIFLVAALTMRQWSEEQRSGTLEMLLTLPVNVAQLVLGKFLAVMVLVLIALSLTLFLPITVGLLGNLDWGPVVGGYLAAILLAAAYAAIGLFLSSRTDNQIVALISTALLGGLFYLVGSRGITDFAGDSLAELLRAIGTGSRFESIERGVIDLRDLIYYLSLTALFLAFNVASLDSKRWGTGQQTRAHRRGIILTILLTGLNLVALNTWLFPISGVRLDLTARREFSLSGTTLDLLGSLEEPLLIRGYFSEKTHPLLAPLVPRIRDTLREYEIAAGGKVVIEIIDPIQDPDKELEANQTYGIRPTPLRAADRYGASVVNAYFDILIRYGDQSAVLGFGDLIEVEPRRDGSVDVRLRNLEYDLTSSIKKVVYGFQSIESVLAASEDPVSLTLFATPGTLPESLQQAQETIEKVAADIQNEAGGKFSFRVINPDAPDSPLDRRAVQEQYGLQPIPVSFFSNQTYYLHMVLQIGDQSQLLFPAGDLSEASVRTSIESAVKRSSSGFLKVVGLWVPPAQQSTADPFGQPQPSLARYDTVREQLRQEYNVRAVDLSGGQVPADVDVLVVIAPQDMTDAERYAIDQYLMRGGAVVIAMGNYVLNPDPFTGNLALREVDAGLRDMVESYGISVEKMLVMDPQNEAFPVQVSRDLGGMQVREIQAISYPFFVDVRPDAMDTGSPIMAGLPAVTMNWASPVVVDPEKNAERSVVTLLRSSQASWLRASSDIQPDLQSYPELGFPIEGEQGAHPLAVSVQGAFESYFSDRPSPFEAEAEMGEGDTAGTEPSLSESTPPPLGTIEVSPESARLVVIGSAEFLNDTVFDISAALTRDRYLNSLAFMQNVVDWSVEDLDLLGIRARGASVRILTPLTEEQQSFWEGINYVLALLALIAIGWVWHWRQRNEEPLVLTTIPMPSEGDNSLSTDEPES